MAMSRGLSTVPRGDCASSAFLRKDPGEMSECHEGRNKVDDGLVCWAARLGDRGVADRDMTRPRAGPLARECLQT